MRYTAEQKTQILLEKLNNRFNILLEWEDCFTLRRASLTLRNWYEKECNNYIFEDNNKTYCTSYDNRGYESTYVINNMEKGAIKRIDRICNKYKNLNYFLQTDPRGTALYLSNKPIKANNYSTEAIGFEV